MSSSAARGAMAWWLLRVTLTIRKRVRFLRSTRRSLKTTTSCVLFATPCVWWRAMRWRHSNLTRWWNSIWMSTMADSLPGLGIVAAVLGVVITMGALGGPPEEIGHKVAAALVGTFLGILLCYGLIGPLAANMAKAADEEHAMYHVVRVVMLAFLKGTSPVMAVEIARRAVPGHRSEERRV